MLVREVIDEGHQFIYEDELATKARVSTRFLVRILPVVDENRKSLGVVSRGNMTISSSISPLRIIGIMAMKTSVTAVKPHAKVREAAELMGSKNIGRIPVKDDKGKLLGIIDREDVARLLV